MSRFVILGFLCISTLVSAQKGQFSVDDLSDLYPNIMGSYDIQEADEKPSPLINFYLYAACINAGDFFKAKEYLKELLDFDADFIPARGYDCSYKKDS